MRSFFSLFLIFTKLTFSIKNCLASSKTSIQQRKLRFNLPKIISCDCVQIKLIGGTSKGFLDKFCWQFFGLFHKFSSSSDTQNLRIKNTDITLSPHFLPLASNSAVFVWTSHIFKFTPPSLHEMPFHPQEFEQRNVCYSAKDTEIKRFT